VTGHGGCLFRRYNFNHERWGIATQAIRFARVCVEEAMKHSFKRKTFGKRLIEHPVIRFKLAQMARQVESAHAWLESITYQMKTLPHDQQNRLLGGPIALLKAHGSQVMEFCAREAAQIFGGLAYTRGGQGEKVERRESHTIPACRVRDEPCMHAHPLSASPSIAVSHNHLICFSCLCHSCQCIARCARTPSRPDQRR